MGDFLFKAVDFAAFFLAVGVACAAAFVALGVITRDIRARLYASRGYKVTDPDWFADLFGAGRTVVEVPEGFVSDHKWLDAKLRFVRPDARPTCPVCGAPRR